MGSAATSGQRTENGRINAGAPGQPEVADTTHDRDALRRKHLRVPVALGAGARDGNHPVAQKPGEDVLWIRMQSPDDRVVYALERQRDPGPARTEVSAREVLHPGAPEVGRSSDELGPGVGQRLEQRGRHASGPFDRRAEMRNTEVDRVPDEANPGRRTSDSVLQSAP